METDDLEPRKTLGAVDALAKEDLSLLGLAELEARISALESEIGRSRAMIASKQGSRSAAEDIFKK